MNRQAKEPPAAEQSANRPGGIKLQRQLGLTHGVGIICGLIIGSGIYVSPQAILREVGSGGVALIMWAVAGVGAMIQALTYAELGTTYPENGEAYLYLYRMYGPVVAFLYSWAYVLLVRPGSNAIKALMFATYFAKPFYVDCDPPGAAVTLVAIFVTVTYGIINSVKVKWAATGQNYFTFLSALSLTIIIVFGFANILFYGQTEHLRKPFEGSKVDASGLMVALVGGSYAFGGWNALNFMVDELINPYRNLPLAICISMAAITVLYLLANVCYFAVLGADGIIDSSAVAVSFGQKAMGPFSICTAYLICISLIGSSNSGLMVTARMWHRSANDGQFPRIAGLINVRYKSPMVAVIVQTSLIILLIFIGDITSIMLMITMAYRWFGVLLAIGIIYHRYKTPQLARPLRLHLSILIINLLLVLASVLIPLISRPVTVLSGIVFCLATGLPYYFVFVVWNPAFFHKYSDVLLLLVQKLTNSARSCRQND